jgi:hypothetical protein
MDKLYYNLSEEEFTKGRKTLLWGFVGFFFLAGIYVLFVSLVLGHKSIPAVLSVAPFGISFVVFVIAIFATIKRADMFFLIDDEKIEFRYGIFKPKKYSFNWIDVKNLVMPHKQRKAKLQFKDGTSFIIDLSYLQRKKSSIIRKHIYHTARSKDLEVIKVDTLKKT